MDGAFLAGVYEAGLNPEAWPDAVDLISKGFGNAKVGLLHFNRLSLSLEGWTHDLDPETWRTRSSAYHDPRNNPSVRIALSMPVGQVLDRRRFIDDSGFDQHPMKLNFFAPNRMFHLMLSTVQREPDSASFLLISRPREAEAFEPREILLGSMLADHVGRAMRTYCALQLADSRALAFDRALDRLSAGVVLVDASLRVLHANAAAGRMLEAGDGVALRLGRVSFSDPRAQQKLAAMRLSDPARGIVDIEMQARRRELPALRVTIFPALGEAAAIAPRSRLLILIRDPEQDAAAKSVARLASAFGLTPSEVRVAALAAAAASTREISACLGSSENTVKTHLKMIYLKTGTSRRAEFVRLVLAQSP